MKQVGKIASAALALMTAGAMPALAHTGVPGHEHGGLMAGLMHPVGGLDHLLAMVAVGIWSALAFKDDVGKVWVAPVTFVLAMVGGAAIGHAGWPLPLVETGIALSVVLLGLMILSRIEFPVALGAGVIALFALFHGHAHGAEAAGSIGAYMAGFALVTAALHAGGIVIGSALIRIRHASTLVGGAVAAAGAYLLAA